jgi:CheY-like chemotaxis protein
MAAARILIVDDEESLLKVLSDSLKGLKSEYEIVTATNGDEAMEHLERTNFELVITDYRMAGMDGLKLLESIRAVRPKTRVIMMTAYGTDELEAETRRLQAYRFLTKPLKINTFRQAVEDALDDLAISRPGILILSDERYRDVMQKLEDLKANVSARSIFLSNLAGQVIAYTGDEDKNAIEKIASLVGGGMATLIESGRIFDDSEDSLNLAYREGPEDCLYAINIGEQLLLILVLHNGPYASRIGSVWFYAQRAAKDMVQAFSQYEEADPEQVLVDDMQGELQTELDGLFEPDPNGDNPDAARSGEQLGKQQGDDQKDESETEIAEKQGDVMSFEEAMQTGVISVDSFDEQTPTLND